MTYNRMPSTSVLANRKWYTGGAKGKVIPKLNLKIACMRPLERIQPSHQIQSRLHASSAKRCIRYLKSTQKYMKVSSAVTPNKNWSSFTVLFHNQVCVRPICTCSSSLRPTALNISPSCWLLRFGRGPSGIKFTMWNKTYANNKLQSQIVTLIINKKTKQAWNETNNSCQKPQNTNKRNTVLSYLKIGWAMQNKRARKWFSKGKKEERNSSNVTTNLSIS